eukprot:TRINITY_DN27069_c0_g1_i1.p1 TRINITY_DN27069_c0_g1~~TRINITY_DN27069_c0_g1_i1.p1  ORF type:complete len:320 (+),score=58.20 TRINITY_DN27069_c0_g1_i1:66-962(+)
MSDGLSDGLLSPMASPRRSRAANSPGWQPVAISPMTDCLLPQLVSPRRSRAANPLPLELSETNLSSQNSRFWEVEDDVWETDDEMAAWKAAESQGLRGSLAVEGRELPPVPMLADIIRKALARASSCRRSALVKPPSEPRVHVKSGGYVSSAMGLPPLPREEGVKTQVECFLFALEAQSAGDVEALASFLRLEALHAGAIGLLPEVALLMEEGSFSCSHCRLHLEVASNGSTFSRCSSGRCTPGGRGLGSSSIGRWSIGSCTPIGGTFGGFSDEWAPCNSGTQVLAVAAVAAVYADVD